MAKKQPSRMRVIALAAAKGGVGKSTLTAALSVRAAQDGARVAIVDQDPQLSLSAWWDRRLGPENPQLYEDVSSSTDTIEQIAAEGYDWLFIDTPPSQLDLMEPVIACSTFVVIPTKAGIMDIEAVKITEELCAHHRRPFAFVLNMVTPGRPSLPVAMSSLGRSPRMLLEPNISHRPSYEEAMWAGMTAAETRDSVARREIDQLWQSLQKAVANTERGRGGKS